MPNLKIIQRIMEVGLVPVVRASSTDEAGAIVEAIKTGGISVLEITMTVPGAIRLIEKISERYGNDVYLRKATVEYLGSARYDDLLAVYSRVSRLGRSSMTFSFEVHREEPEPSPAALVTAELVYVNADPATMKAKNCPEADPFIRPRVREGWSI